MDSTIKPVPASSFYESVTSHNLIERRNFHTSIFVEVFPLPLYGMRLPLERRAERSEKAYSLLSYLRYFPLFCLIIEEEALTRDLNFFLSEFLRCLMASRHRMRHYIQYHI